MTTNYLAYGSNMNLEQMAFRCPEAIFKRVTWLEGYRLVFKGEREQAYATIVEDTSSRIPVMIWEINAQDEATLDQYERVPELYGKATLELDDEVVMYYYMQPENDYGFPSERYYKTIESAYQKQGLDTQILELAYQESRDYWNKKEAQ
ncbi:MULTISPECIES: gamma-glutamylcyclotransferase family protein [unclassified Facklamia]|uniref:gamma-glutamylcyclotransferase family protein n=1 Tax=Aerococcaceae TaxID=186827 RepID=UPI0013BDCE9D|nr:MULTISPECIES: gamma-glutamylcyclotransferase family protein [unclassified Facklamia]NEW64729.1 gamma-glutamylcyclotransferase [Facklamia sp. 252]NEW68054.1 gamma-glutamylcyclotransferase [Facklamia sp. 253]QQD65010.1 gamma-glutamylcyclotransferase [Aerococcaceae bacterium zg-252]